MQTLFITSPRTYTVVSAVRISLHVIAVNQLFGQLPDLWHSRVEVQDPQSLLFVYRLFVIVFLASRQTQWNF